MDGSTTRRDFLKQLAIFLAAGSGAALADALAQQAARAWPELRGELKIAPWTGDDFTFGHRLRDLKTPVFPDKIERTVDFVIIGGGIAGLCAAYYLKDHNFLLLEQYEDLGGHARGGNYKGIGYSYASQYFNYADGLIGELLHALGLNPVKLDTTKNAWLWEKNWLPGVSGQDSNVAYREFKRLTTEFRPLWKTLKGKNPTIPLTDEELLSLDKTPLSNYLKKYHPSFVALMDAFLKSASCAGSEGLSALAGSSILEDLIVPSYVLPGANPSFARALVQNLSQDKQQRMLGKAFVWSVTLSDSGATVVFGTRDGVLHRVRCRHVIMAVPALVAGRIMFNMKPADKAQFFTFRYGSYLVANFLLKKKVFSGSYDNFCAPPFSFADITIAETPYMRSGQYKPTMGSVLTVYQPYAPGSEGRSVLLEGNREKLARTLASQLVALFKDIEPAIGSVVLSRWGHAMAVTNPGYYARMSKIISAQTDSYSLAHSSFRGLPCIESAVEGARMAADRALKIKRTARARS